MPIPGARASCLLALMLFTSSVASGGGYPGVDACEFSEQVYQNSGGSSVRDKSVAGHIYSIEHFGCKSTSRAKELLLAAAEGGDVDAQLRLCQVKAALIEAAGAVAWCIVASRSGSTEAAQTVELFRETVDPQVFSDGADAAEKFLKSLKSMGSDSIDP